MKKSIRSNHFVCFAAFIFWITIGPVQANTKQSGIRSTIQSKQLKVELDNHFPRIMAYHWLADNSTFYGQEDNLTQVVINGLDYTPAVRFVAEANHAEYWLNIEEIQVEIKIAVSVNANILDFAVTHIAEKGSFRVNTFEIPNHNLISIRSNQSGAAFAGARMYTKVTGNGDTFLKINNETPVDTVVNGYLYGILSTNHLAATLWSNSVSDSNDNHRVQQLSSKKEGYLRCGLWSGEWIIRAKGMTSIDPLPRLKIIITGDSNNDRKIDWQDGAIAYRKIMNNPEGSDKVKELVVQRIPMNFASQATNPFTKTLDETKRIYLYTDGLGQYVILKGYGSEGHDSAHPDYGVIGQRQGGATDMEMLCRQAQQYHAFMGVHINGTESYPEARAFNDSLVIPSKPGWDWLDASYYINKRYDAYSGERAKRLQSLKKQVPSLNFIYCDVWYAKGSWDSRKLGREIHNLGWTLATEFPMDHEYDAVSNHWAVDYNYGGKDIKGINSSIVRFIRNHQKDTWIARHPLLGGTEMMDFEGWQGRTNIDSCIYTTFHTNLPAKFLQHFPILSWNDDSITFEGGVAAKKIDDKRTITQQGRVVAGDKAYLLPWNPLTAEKLYYWNEQPGSTTWELPTHWKNNKKVWLYRLTDQGKVAAGILPVVDGTITIDAEAGKPYVVYPKAMANTTDIKWGEGSGLTDPGFNSGNLSGWTVNGNGATVERNERGQYELVMQPGGEVSVSQSLTALIPGSYYASVYVTSNDNRKASLGATNGEGVTQRVSCSSSLWKNYISADSKNDKNMQRMYLYFTIPEGKSSVTLSLQADKGNGECRFDDLRMRAITHAVKSDSIYFAEDFEHIPDGLYPFVKGPAGGITDPRTHLAERHDPFTQKGWNGKLIDDVIEGNWSLKAHGEATGLLLQTIPQTLPFAHGKTYTITFLYQASGSDYALVLGEGNEETLAITLNSTSATTPVTFTFTGSKSGNSWFGIYKQNENNSDLVIDNISISEK